MTRKWGKKEENNNFFLNANTTKETVDPQKSSEQHSLMHIGDSETEMVDTFKFLGIHNSEELFWSHNTTYSMRKPPQHPRLKTINMTDKILSDF